MGVGMPAELLLQEFGEHLQCAFGHTAYLVGSALIEKSGWRDVDVRVMLPDEEWDAMGLGDPERTHYNKRWCSIVLAWSSFGRSLTGLPIDFQLQKLSWANEKEGRANGKSRGALFRLRDLRWGVACPECGVVNCDHGARKAREVSRDVFDLVEGLSPIDPAQLAGFEKEMNERVIPDIVATMRRRAERVQASRDRILT